MIAYCHACYRVVKNAMKIRVVDCPLCGTYDTLKRITKQQAARIWAEEKEQRKRSAEIHKRLAEMGE